MNTMSMPRQRGESCGLLDCPYRGLMPYTEDDAEFFFGRDRNIRLIINNLKAYRLTVLYGPSGVGKTSVLLAGVVRRMHDEEEESLATFGVRESVVVYCNNWRDDPMLMLGGLVQRGFSEAYPDAELALPDRLEATALAAACDALDVDAYLMLDQFEEYFLYHGDSPLDCEFATELSAINAVAPRVNLLIALREDSLARLDRFEEHIPRLFDYTLRLDHLDYECAREAVLEPLRRYNELASFDSRMAIEPELVDRVLDQVQAGRIRIGGASEGEASVAAPSTGERRIEAPFLQLILTRLWSTERARHSTRLRVTTLDDLGGAASIVRDHLDRVLDHLTPDDKELVAAAFRHLVTPSGAKIAHTASDLAYFAGVDATAMHRVLQLLCSGDQRILREVRPPLDGGDQESRYEVFHDVLALAVLEWRRRYDAEQQRHQAERELVAAKHQAEETRHQLRRFRLLSATLALLLLIVLGLGYLVKRGIDDARNREHLAVYEQKLQSDPPASLRAALLAWRKRHTPEAETAVRIALDANTERRVFQANHGLVVTSEFDPAGETILTAGQDGTAKLFDAGTGRLVRTFPTNDAAALSPLTGASFSPDRSMVVTANMDGQVYVYDAGSGRRLAALVDYNDRAFAQWGRLRGRNVVLTSSWNGAPELWDPGSPNRPIARYGIKTLRESAGLSRDGEYVVTIGPDRIARVWEATSGRLIVSSPRLGRLAMSPRFVSPESDRVAAFAAATNSLWRVVFWDWRGSGSVERTPWQGRQVSELAVSKDGRLVAAGLDKRAVVFDATDGRAEGGTPEEPDLVSAVDLSPDGRWLLTGNKDGPARVWSATRWNNRPTGELLGHRGAVSDAQFYSLDPRIVLTAGNDGTARSWELPVRSVLAGSGSSARILNADLSPDGRHVILADSSGWLLIRRSDTGELEGKYRQPDASGACPSADFCSNGAIFTPDGTTVVATSALQSRPIVWRWRSRRPPTALEDNRIIITRVAVSPDGRTAAAGDRRNHVVLWDLATGKILVQLTAGREDYIVSDVAYIPYSNLIAAASNDGTVRVWDLRQPDRPPRTLGRPNNPGMRAIDVSSDGRYLVAAAEDYALYVWGVSDGKREQRFDGPHSRIGDVAFSPDGSLVAVGAADTAVHVWRWRDDHKLAVLRRHGDAVNSVDFTADGTRILSASDDSTAALFPSTARESFQQVLRAAERVGPGP